MISLLNANALKIPIADQAVQCCVTSPPYWGLRDYGVSNQLGLEPTPEEYVSNMVQVFREVWRVLRDDGTLWLNLGDSYAVRQRGGEKAHPDDKSYTNKGGVGLDKSYPDLGMLKPKDLVGIPWRVAFALQADGWYLRSDIIWAKPNPMPESVTDRPTKAHEYIFLMSKSQRYFYDAEAIKEKAVEGNDLGILRSLKAADGQGPTRRKDINKRLDAGIDSRNGNPSGNRNRRTVWTVATEPYKGAHFATYPTALVEPCIKAGSKPGDIILDPFAGSGTTLLVARELGRSAIGLDLSMSYLRDQAHKRLEMHDLFAGQA